MSDKVLSQFKQEETTEEIKTERKVKVGVIGCGGISYAHFNNYLKMPDVEIVAIADLIPEQMETKANEFGLPDTVRRYPSHKELIDNEPDLDIVSICTYNSQHAAPAIYALDHGINVVLEKPFTATVEEAVEVMRAEKRSGKVLSIGFQPRYAESMKMIKEVVQSGILGKIYYIQTGGGRRRGIPGGTFIEKDKGVVGALGDIGCYSLDMVLNAIGYPKPLTVSGYVSDFFGKRPEYNEFPEDAERFEVDDFGAAFIRLEGDIILDFRISWAMHPNTPGDTIIMGTEGALRIPSTDCWNGSIPDGITLYHDVCGKQTETKLPHLTDDDPVKTLFYKKIRSVIDKAVYGLDSDTVPSSQIIYNQAIINAILDSAKLGREVEVVIPEI